MIRRPPGSTLFPSTSLFRSRRAHRRLRLGGADGARDVVGGGGAHLRARARHLRGDDRGVGGTRRARGRDRKSTRLNSSHANISYAVFCLKKKRLVVEIVRKH